MARAHAASRKMPSRSPRIGLKISFSIWRVNHEVAGDACSDLFLYPRSDRWRSILDAGPTAGAGDSDAWVLGRSLNWTHVGREGQRQRGELAQGDEVLP